MSIENPIKKFDADDEIVAQMKGVVEQFIEKTPEYQKLNFSDQEINTAVALLANSNVTGADDIIAKKALDARVAARRIKE